MATNPETLTKKLGDRATNWMPGATKPAQAANIRDRVSEIAREIKTISENELASQRPRRNVLLNAIYSHVYNSPSKKQVFDMMKETLAALKGGELEKNLPMIFLEEGQAEMIIGMIGKETNPTRLSKIKTVYDYFQEINPARINDQTIPTRDRKIQMGRRLYQVKSACLTQEEKDELAGLRRYAAVALSNLNRFFPKDKDRAFIIHALLRCLPCYSDDYAHTKKTVECYWSLNEKQKNTFSLSMGSDAEFQYLGALRDYFTKDDNQECLESLRRFKDLWQTFLKGYANKQCDNSKKARVSSNFPTKDGRKTREKGYHEQTKPMIFAVLDKASEKLNSKESLMNRVFRFFTNTPSMEISLKMLVWTISQMIQQYGRDGWPVRDIWKRSLGKLNGVWSEYWSAGKGKPFSDEDVTRLKDLNWRAELEFIYGFLLRCEDPSLLNEIYTLCEHTRSLLNLDATVSGKQGTENDELTVVEPEKSENDKGDAITLECCSSITEDETKVKVRENKVRLVGEFKFESIEGKIVSDTSNPKKKYEDSTSRKEHHLQTSKVESEDNIISLSDEVCYGRIGGTGMEKPSNVIFNPIRPLKQPEDSVRTTFKDTAKTLKPVKLKPVKEVASSSNVSIRMEGTQTGQRILIFDNGSKVVLNSLRHPKMCV